MLPVVGQRSSFSTTFAEFYDPCIYGFGFDGRKYSYVREAFINRLIQKPFLGPVG